MGNQPGKHRKGVSGGPHPVPQPPDDAPARAPGAIATSSAAASSADASSSSSSSSSSNGGGTAADSDISIQESLCTVADTSDTSKMLRVELGHFELLKVLGKGSFGKVLLVRKKAGKDAGKLYALKTLRKEVLIKRNQIAHTKTERSVLQTVDFPFLVTLRYAWQTADKLYLVTDYAPGGELFFWLKRDRVFSQSRVKLYAAELVLALEHLHNLDVVYRDLKPENILLDEDGHIKLTDFGLSKEAVTGAGAEGGTLTFCGTPEYLAPEILENAGHGKAVDWWSLGTLLYEMCAGLPPFYHENIEEMYEKIMTAKLEFPRHFLPETRSLLTGMLQRDYRRRLGFNGAGEIKAHPFFAGIDWDAVAARRVTPVFRPPPPLTDADTPNFEDEFTNEAPVDSMPDPKALSATQVEKAHFEGFTYAEESAMGKSGGSMSSGIRSAADDSSRKGSFTGTT